MYDDQQESIPTKTESEITSEKGELSYHLRKLASATEVEKKEIYVTLISICIGILADAKIINPEYEDETDAEKKRGIPEYLCNKFQAEFDGLDLVFSSIEPERFLKRDAMKSVIGEKEDIFFTDESQGKLGMEHVTNVSAMINNKKLSAFFIKVKNSVQLNGLYNSEKNFAGDGLDFDAIIEMAKE